MSVQISQLQLMLSFCTRLLKAPYHVHHMLTAKNDKSYIKLHPKLMRSYLQSFLKEQFCERKALILLTDAVRSEQSAQYVMQIIEKIGNNIDSIQGLGSIVTFTTHMCTFKMNNRDFAMKAFTRGFQMTPYTLETEENTFFSFNYLKLLIAVDILVGLQSFPQQIYEKIPFQFFKPLHLCFTIELFYMRGLQSKYPIADELIDKFIKCENFIPFADFHHLKYATRVISNKKFKDCIQRVHQNILKNISDHNTKSSSSHENQKIENSDKPQNAKPILQDRAVYLNGKYINISKIYRQDLRNKYSI